MSRELVRRAQGGDREAFGELARLYAPLVTGALLSRVGRFQDAEDLVQETFLRALRQIGSLKDPDRAGAWLYGIAVNVAREHRRAHPAPAALPAEVPEPRPEAGPAVDADMLRGCLERLPEGLREIFILRHIKNLSYKELGQIRNITVSSVGERLWTARRLLRQCLERRGGLGLSEA